MLKFLKTLFNTGKKTTESVGKSMDFIDEVLEKDLLSSAVDNLKTSTGQLVEQAGKVYQKTVDTIDENVDLDKVKDNINKAIDTGKEVTETITDSIVEKSKDLGDTIREGEEFIKGIIKDEEDSGKDQ